MSAHAWPERSRDAIPTTAEALLAVVCDMTADPAQRLAAASALWPTRDQLTNGRLRDLGDALEQLGDEAHQEALERCHVQPCPVADAARA